MIARTRTYAIRKQSRRSQILMDQSHSMERWWFGVTKSDHISTGEAARRLGLRSSERVRQLGAEGQLETERVLDRVAVNERSVERLAGRRASARVDRVVKRERNAGAAAAARADRTGLLRTFEDMLADDPADDAEDLARDAATRRAEWAAMDAARSARPPRRSRGGR